MATAWLVRNRATTTPSDLPMASTGTPPLRFTEAAACELSRAVSTTWPLEGCGLCLARTATPTRIERCVVLQNVHPEPRHRFAIDPHALLGELRTSRATGWVLRAFFHSHPDGVATPSEADVRLAAAGGMSLWPSVDQIIASTRGPHLRHVARYEVEGATWRRAPLGWPSAAP